MGPFKWIQSHFRKIRIDSIKIQKTHPSYLNRVCTKQSHIKKSNPNQSGKIQK